MIHEEPVISLLMVEVQETAGVWRDVTGELQTMSVDRGVEKAAVGYKAKPGSVSLQVKYDNFRAWEAPLFDVQQPVRVRGIWSEQALVFTGVIDAVHATLDRDDVTGEQFGILQIECVDKVKKYSNTVVKQVVTQPVDSILSGEEQWSARIARLHSIAGEANQPDMPSLLLDDAYRLGERKNGLLSTPGYGR